MPQDPSDAIGQLHTPAAATWAPTDLYALRALILAEYDGPDLLASVERIDQLLALHA